jgi:RHS repeat-associated protein
VNNVTTSGTTASATQTVDLTRAWQRVQVTGANQNGLGQLYLQIGGGGSFPAGQIIYVWGAEMVMGSSAGTPVQTAGTTANDATGASVYLAPNGLNESYTYDSFGNMQQSGNFSFVQTYTAANRLSGWSYDASGNLLNDGLGNNYTYDSEGRTSTVAGYSYVYDAQGDRVSKVGSAVIDHVYFAGRELARLAGGQWSDLIYGASGLLAEVPGTQTGSPVYRMTDYLGSAVGTMDSNGVLLSSSDYAPFGQLFVGGSTDPYQFTGKERDAESGKDYFGARYYASSMGRWMSPDWSDDPDPIPYADLENPQSFNLYGYTGNNPLSAVDSDGHVYSDSPEDPMPGLVPLSYLIRCVTCHSPSQRMTDGQFNADVLDLETRVIFSVLFQSRFRSPLSLPAQPAQSTPADPNQGKPKFEPNKNKHHQNAKGKASAEPTNSEDLYKNATKSKNGTWWAKDSDGVLHRFSSDNAGGAHWSGSTAGENGIQSQNIPGDIKNAFGWTK